ESDRQDGAEGRPGGDQRAQVLAGAAELGGSPGEPEGRRGQRADRPRQLRERGGGGHRDGEAPKAHIPTSPPEVVVGIPADLIRRRPDLRSAERQVAAQNAQIGVADADFYPAFFINGTIGFEAMDLAKLFASKSMTGQVGP